MAKTAKKTAKSSKAQQIRDATKAIGKKVQPKDVIAALKKKGVVVSSAPVSMTLHAAGIRRKRRAKKITAGPISKPSHNGLTLDNLLAANAQIEKVGSVKAAEETLAAMKKLG